MNNFPKVEYVTYTTDDIPKLGKVKFRTFTVGEHKQFLEAVAMGQAEPVLDTLCDIIGKCTFGKINVSKTEMYLLDRLYLDIYIKSKGANSPVTYRCSNHVTGEDGNEKVCGNTMNVNIPLTSAYLDIPEDYAETAIVKISETAGIKLRQPCLEDFKRIKDADGKVEITEKFLYSSIECIYDGDRLMYPGQDFDLPGLMAYIETLPDTVMPQIEAFFDSTPQLKIELPITCTKCGYKETIKLAGLDDFFA